VKADGSSWLWLSVYTKIAGIQGQQFSNFVSIGGTLESIWFCKTLSFYNVLLVYKKLMMEAVERSFQLFFATDEL